ncbi:MAG: succinate dehydrogenase, hydrophobic membrane anchor protein [Alphaproteobacteria bacterium]
MSLRTPIGRVRGLGSAKDGTEHFWMQRVSAIALVPLILWFTVSLVTMTGAGYVDVVTWLSSPLVAILMLLMITAGFYHLKLGLQVVIEDYVHSEGLKLAALLLNTFFCLAVGVAAAFAVLKIAFGG